MAKASDKSPEMKGMLENMFGRSTAIAANRCVLPPLGCGKPAVEFRDALSQHEYAISGLCQACQDELFDSSPG